MVLGQALCLGQEFLAGRNDDDHVAGPVSVVVLIGDVINILGLIADNAQTGGLAGLVVSQRDIVKAGGAACYRLDGEVVVYGVGRDYVYDA